MAKKEGKRPNSANLARQLESDERVGELLDLIAQGVHMGRPTLKRKAAQWGISLSQAEHIDAKASQILRFKYQDDRYLKTEIFHRIRAIANLALARTRLERRKNKASPTGYDEIQVPDPDFQSALQALKLIGMDLGMFEARHRLTVDAVTGRLLDAAEKALGPDNAAKLFETFLAQGESVEDVQLPELPEPGESEWDPAEH